MMTYEQAAEYIGNIGRFSIKNSNRHTRMCLERLGAPDRIFPQIHIAGTNGKGSVCAYLADILEESGRKTALFTSPHLVRINERISVNGRPISDEEFLHVFLKVHSLAEELIREGEQQPSYFEFLFLMAEVYFAEQGVDAAVIETGLGGRLDATNCLEDPALTVITSIGMDHMQYLGHTIPEIAAEKAGILRPGVPCVYTAYGSARTAGTAGDCGDAPGAAEEDCRNAPGAAEEDCRNVHAETAARVIGETAARLGAPAFCLRSEDVEILRLSSRGIDFRTSFGYDGVHEFHVTASAPYQAENAALAVLAVKALAENEQTGNNFRDITAEHVRRGLANMRWPGRMEEIAPRTYLDGGHNEDGIRAFLEAVRAVTGLAGGLSSAPMILLFAVVGDKDYEKMIRLLASFSWTQVIVTEVADSRRADSGAVGELFRESGCGCVNVEPDFRRAYGMAAGARGEGWLFICGSLYLAGDLKSILSDQ